MLVSIHAPVWGATHGLHDLEPFPLVSIHAPVWGATKGLPCCSPSSMFQSTRPYGARRELERILRGLVCFNPRARMGRDLADGGLLQGRQVSIHAPVWGAT